MKITKEYLLNLAKKMHAAADKFNNLDGSNRVDANSSDEEIFEAYYIMEEYEYLKSFFKKNIVEHFMQIHDPSFMNE